MGRQFARVSRVFDGHGIGRGGACYLPMLSSRSENEHTESDPSRRCDRQQTGQRQFERG